MADYTPEQLAKIFDEAARGRLVAAIQSRAVKLALFAEVQGKRNATTRLRVRSGTLRRSIAGTARGRKQGASVDLAAGGRVGGEDVPYAGVQEFGATIRPRLKKWLAIPLPDVQTGAGVARFASPRDYPTPLVFRKQSERQAFLLDPTDGRAKWLLRKEVTVSPKHYLRDAMRETERQVPTEMADVLSAVVLVQPAGGDS